VKPQFFRTAAEFRSWLAHNHRKASELLVGFYRKSSGKPSMTYHEALDEALCVGWIDGVRRARDAESYEQRFTPRKPRSYWSHVNIGHAKRLIECGRMKAAGLREFEKRDEAAARRYSNEQKTVAFDEAREKRFRQNAAAWEFFLAQPAGYRRVMTHRVMSAKREETREKRLDQLIRVSARARRVDLLKPDW
jgi:uncharacterized protein YdeI (YjbR/CyaY-like superfamily)